MTKTCLPNLANLDVGKHGWSHSKFSPLTKCFGNLRTFAITILSILLHQSSRIQSLVYAPYILWQHMIALVNGLQNIPLTRCHHIFTALDWCCRWLQAVYRKAYISWIHLVVLFFVSGSTLIKQNWSWYVGNEYWFTTNRLYLNKRDLQFLTTSSEAETFICAWQAEVRSIFRA